MQLADLLTRMTDQERRALAKSRLGIDVASTDAASLAAMFSDPVVISRALAQINLAQMRILRWLVRRPALQATWGEFVEALGGALPETARDEYLRRLRELLLLDYDVGRGSIATYPAVSAALPVPRQANLRAHLNQLKADSLHHMILAQELTSRLTRKDERIELIHETLTTAESCRALLARRTPSAHVLFQWLLDRGGWVDAATMYSRVGKPVIIERSYYYSADAWWSPRPSPKELANPLVELVRCGLVVAVQDYRSSWYPASGYAIAEDVELASQGRSWFDRDGMHPPPLQPADGVAGTEPILAAFLRDLAHLLGFVKAGRCEYRQDGQPYKRSLTALGKLLGRRDAEYAGLIWDLAVLGGFLRRGRSGETDYVPVKLDKLAPLELLARTVNGWLAEATHLDAPYIVLDTSPIARRRILDLLATVPADTWMQRRSLEAWLRFSWPMIFRPNPAGGDGAAGDWNWDSLGEFLVARGADGDGQPAVMVPADHQKLLALLLLPERPASWPESPVLPPWDDGWTVQADRLVVAPPNASPEALIALWQVATLESNQGASLFRLTPESVAGALNRGMRPAAVQKLLASRSRVPLPPTVERLIDDQGKRYGRIRVGSASTYITTDDPALLDELQRDSRAKKLQLRVIAPGVAVVDGPDRADVIAALRAAGHLPVPDETAGPAKGPAKGALAVVAPAAQPGADGRRQPALPAKPMAPSAVRRLVRDAIARRLSLFVTQVEDGEQVEVEVAPIDFHGHTLHAVDLDAVEDIELPLDALVAVELGSDISDLEELFGGLR